MRAESLGRVGQPGGVEPGACMSTPGHLALVVRWRDTCTVVGLKFSPLRHRIDAVWHRTLGGNVFHLWAGHQIVLNVASILSVGQGHLFVAGGTERLLVDGASGTILVVTSVASPPSAPASLLSAEVIVPEGQVVGAYDLAASKLTWRRPTPQQTWAFAPMEGELLPVQGEQSEVAALWHFRHDALWTLPGVSYVTAAPVVCGSVALIPSGGGPPDRLTALDLGTGAVQWSIDFPRPELLRPPAQGPFPFPYPAVALGDQVIVATALPTLEARAIASGASIWRIGLTAQPTALALVMDTVWVGTADGSVIAVDAISGAAHGQTVLTGLAEFPAAIVPLPEHSTMSAVMVIARLGNIYGITL